METNDILILLQGLDPPLSLALAQVYLSRVRAILCQEPDATYLRYSLKRVSLLYFDCFSWFSEFDLTHLGFKIIVRRKLFDIKLLMTKAQAQRIEGFLPLVDRVNDFIQLDRKWANLKQVRPVSRGVGPLLSTIVNVSYDWKLSHIAHAER